jgi:hypothetical protein
MRVLVRSLSNSSGGSAWSEFPYVLEFRRYMWIPRVNGYAI